MFFENYSIYMYTACNIPVNFVLARFKFHKKQKMNGKKKRYCLLQIQTLQKST